MAAQTASVRALPHCRQCAGLADRLEFSRSGERRGELAKLAEATGISTTILSRAFGGLTVPSLRTIVLTAGALGVSESCIIRYPPVWHRLCQDFGD